MSAIKDLNEVLSKCSRIHGAIFNSVSCKMHNNHYSVTLKDTKRKYSLLIRLHDAYTCEDLGGSFDGVFVVSAGTDLRVAGRYLATHVTKVDVAFKDQLGDCNWKWSIVRDDVKSGFERRMWEHI